MPSPSDWENRFERFIRRSVGDVAHDLEHIRRVVANARRLCAAERGSEFIVLPAAWLHDCVTVPKDSPDRHRASMLAADRARAYLRRAGYPVKHLEAIHHAIAAHSFSAGIPPETLEARIVQDADRLDALGAIGLSRCLMLGGAMNRRLYDPAEPFPVERPADDRTNTIDHLYVKLLRLPGLMQTSAGRREARRRATFLRTYLRELRHEL